MSKLFFDKLIVLDRVEVEIKKVAKTTEEKEELWRIVDEIVNHRVLDCVLDNLPRNHHEEFLNLFSQNPHDEERIFSFLEEKSGRDMKKTLVESFRDLGKEIMRELQSEDEG